MIIINTDSLQNLKNTTVCHISELPQHLNKGKKLLVKTGDNGFDILQQENGPVLCGHARNSVYDMALVEPIDLAANKIYAHNIGFVHPNFVNVPLGVYKDSVPLLEFLMPDIYFSQKTIFVYANFTNWCGRERAHQVCKNASYISMDDNNLQMQTYYEKMANACFTVCPSGNGHDTYRLWEALCLRSYPIVKNHTFYDHFKFLPLIRINQWEDMYHPEFQNFLIGKKAEFDQIRYEPFLTEDYWKNLIEQDDWNENSPHDSDT